MTHDFAELLDEYETLVVSMETQTCEHGGRRYVGNDWKACCGYDEEYRHDILVRDVLETILSQRAPGDSLDVAARVADLDERLYRLYEPQPTLENGWWRQGFPKGVG